jgi:hypothetical protein
VIGIAALISLTAAAPAAHAENTVSEEPLLVVVEADPGSADAQALRAAVERELGVPVVSAADGNVERTRGTLSISADGRGRVVLAYRDDRGHELWRTTAVPDDPVGVVSTVAFLAGNLVRNEADAWVESSSGPASAWTDPEKAAEGGRTVAYVAPSDAPISNRPAPSDRTATKDAAASHPSGAEQRALVREHPQRAFRALTDRWLVSAGGGVTVGELVAGTATVGFARNFGRAAVGALFSTSHGGGRVGPNGAEVTHGLHSLAATADLRVPAGRTVLEAGAAFGASVYSFRGDVSYSGITPYGAVRVTLVIPLVPSLDLLISGTGVTTFRTLDAGGEARGFSPFRAGASLGLRGRFP